MRVLALDPATHCGWAVSSEGRADPALSGTWDLAPQRGESRGMRFVRFRKELEVMRAAYPDLELVVYEQAHHRGGAATEVGVGLATHIQCWCAELGLEYSTVHTATLKKFATGSGRANKDAMLAAAHAKWGVLNVKDDNQADALWLLAYALDKVVPREGG